MKVLSRIVLPSDFSEVIFVWADESKAFRAHCGREISKIQVYSDESGSNGMFATGDRGEGAGVGVEPPPFYLFHMFVCAFDTCASLAAWRLLNTNGKPRWDVDLTMKWWNDSVVLFLNE